jgi:fatty acid-binding protein DegV
VAKVKGNESHPSDSQPTFKEHRKVYEKLENKPRMHVLGCAQSKSNGANAQA